MKRLFLLLTVAGWLGAPSASASPAAIRATTSNGPLRGMTALWFVVREPHDDWFHPTSQRQRIEAKSAGQQRFATMRGLPGSPGEAVVCRLDLSSGRREIRLHAHPGDIRGCCLDPDGRRLILSLRLGGAEQPYRLAELDLEPPAEPATPARVRFLTEGFGDDIDPVVTPDGSILFVSSRAGGWSRTHDAPRFALYRCAADGTDAQPYGSQFGIQRTPVLWTDGTVMSALAEADDGVGSWRIRLSPGEDEPTGGKPRQNAPCSHLSVFQPRPLPDGSGFVAVAVPKGALTREKGWLVQVKVSPGPGLSRGWETLPWLLEEGDRHERLHAAAGSAPSPEDSELPIHVEHPEFRWRYPWPIGEEDLLAVTDREIWLVRRRSPPELLFVETEFAGELAQVFPVVEGSSIAQDRHPANGVGGIGSPKRADSDRAALVSASRATAF